MLQFIADQIGGRIEAFPSYAGRAQTRREHLVELQIYLNLRLARREDRHALFKGALEEANGTDRGDAIVTTMIIDLRARGILLPAPSELERLALAARALARRRAYQVLTADLGHERVNGLAALIKVNEKGHTPLAWLREWPEAPSQKNLVGIVERLQAVRKLGIGPDREQRIHRARHAAIARETAILSAQHLSRFDATRRLAALVVFAREMEAILTDAALVMFDKMLGSVLRRADQAHKQHMVDRAKALDASTQALLGMAKAMLAAKACGEDQIAAVERALGWERLNTLVAEADQIVTETRKDHLGEMVERYPTVRRLAPILLGAFVFRAWKPDDPLLGALDALRALYAAGQKGPSA